MFPNASPHKIEARTAAALNTSLEGYRSTVASWYDGTPRSIEARIANCDRLIHRARSAGPQHQAAVVEMTEDRQVLANLRSSLLSAHQDREVETMRVSARRDYEIEARAFVRDNIDVVGHLGEIGERARRHAARCGADPEGFVATCVVVAKQVPRQKTAAPTTHVEDFPDHGLFI